MKLTLRVKELAERMGIENANQFRGLVGLHYKHAYDLWNGVPKSLSIETIENLCTFFKCSPNELLGYQETKKKK